nr:hypothetical protein [Tanacetum cinerariifolium]
MCINCTYGDGKPVTCCVCEGPLRGGFCLFCNSKAENSFTYDPNSYHFNDTSSNFNHLLQPQYNTYLCELCGNNSHYGYDCPPQFSFVYEQEPSYNQNYNDNYYPHDSPSFLCCDNCGGSHETFQCQPMNQNTDSSGFDLIQIPKYPVIHHSSQEMSEEVFQAKGNLMKSIQTFLEKFNRIPSGEMPNILLQAWEKFFAIQHTQPEDSNELFQKLLEDLQIINKELAEYINSSSWDRPTFFNDNEEHSVQYKEYLENSSNKINFIVKKSSISLNNTSQISPVHAITPVLPIEEHEYSLSMGYEHLSTIPETESDEVIKSSAKNLLPIPSEYEVTSDDESECDVPVKDEFFLVFKTFSNSIFDDNDDFTSSDDKSISDEDVSTEDFKVYSNPFFDDEEINSNEIDPHCFNAESDFVKSLSNCDTLFDSSLKFDYLEEFSGALIVDEERIRREHEEYISLMEKLFSINPCPCLLENFHANTIVETLPTSPIPLEDIDSQREEIDIFTGTDELLPPSIESDDYDLKGDIHFLKELLVDNSIPFPENESSDFDHQDDSSFPRPPPEPSDFEFFFDLKPNSGELI